MKLKSLIVIIAISALSSLNGQEIRIENSSFPLYVQPNSLTCTVGETRVVEELENGNKVVGACVTINGMTSGVNTGVITLEKIPSYESTGRTIEASFTLAQIAKQIYPISGVAKGEFLIPKSEPEKPLQAFTLQTEIQELYRKDESGLEQLLHIPVKINYRTACIVEFKQSEMKFISYSPTTVFTKSFPASNDQLLPKALNLLVDSAVKAIIEHASSGPFGSEKIGPDITKALANINPTENPFLNSNGQLNLTKENIDLISFRLLDFLKISKNWDPLSNLETMGLDPDKEGNKIAQEKYRAQIADIILSQLIFGQFHQAARTPVDFKEFQSLVVQLTKQIAFLLSDSPKQLQNVLNKTETVYQFVKYSGSQPDLGVYRLSTDTIFSSSLHLLAKIRLMASQCFEGFVACKK